MQPLKLDGLSPSFCNICKPQACVLIATKLRGRAMRQLELRKALKDGINTIAVVGGDGTLSEAAEGF